MALSLKALGQMLWQTFPGTPRFTEKDVPDLTDKVVIVTGANTGIGKHIANVCYSHNARVYMLARSRDKTLAAIEDIKTKTASQQTPPKGTMEYIHLDLADLTTIRTTTDAFLAKESQLHVLFNNAGVGFGAQGAATKQGYELQIGVNCLGSLALTECLTPTLQHTAKTFSQSQPSAVDGPITFQGVRVVWTSSSAAIATDPKRQMTGIHVVAKDPKNAPVFRGYSLSKLGNFLHGAEYSRLHADEGIYSVSLNPGNLDSDLWRDLPAFAQKLLKMFVLYPVVNGAYTTLFAGFSPEVTREKSGRFIVPFGQLWTPTPPFYNASRTKEEGGYGTAAEFWAWSMDQIKPYL